MSKKMAKCPCCGFSLIPANERVSELEAEVAELKAELDARRRKQQAAFDFAAKWAAKCCLDADAEVERLRETMLASLNCYCTVECRRVLEERER